MPGYAMFSEMNESLPRYGLQSSEKTMKVVFRKTVAYGFEKRDIGDWKTG